MKNVIAAKSSSSSPRPKAADARTGPPPAAPITSQATPVPPSDTSIVGPRPKRAFRGPTSAAEASDPMPASMKSMPTCPAENESSRAAKRITTAT